MEAITWDDVTLGEFAALALIQDGDAAAHLEEYWQRKFDAGAYPFTDEAPKLSRHAGKVLTQWAERLRHAHANPEACQYLAREVLAGLGTLTVMQYRDR